MKEANDPQMSELCKTILKGMEIASFKLMEERAAMGESLVVSVNGKPELVPAKELLKELLKDFETDK
jgi:hypothetical protein